MIVDYLFSGCPRAMSEHGEPITLFIPSRALITTKQINKSNNIMKFNTSGNWAPSNIPIYTVILTRTVHGYAEGDKVEVVESQHPSFTEHWQILRCSSLFIKKEFAKLLI